MRININPGLDIRVKYKIYTYCSIISTLPLLLLGNEKDRFGYLEQ